MPLISGKKFSCWLKANTIHCLNFVACIYRRFTLIDFRRREREVRDSFLSIFLMHCGCNSNCIGIRLLLSCTVVTHSRWLIFESHQTGKRQVRRNENRQWNRSSLTTGAFCFLLKTNEGSKAIKSIVIVK